jgi:hypothetical protein
MAKNVGGSSSQNFTSLQNPRDSESNGISTGDSKMNHMLSRPDTEPYTATKGGGMVVGGGNVLHPAQMTVSNMMRYPETHQRH